MTCTRSKMLCPLATRGPNTEGVEIGPRTQAVVSSPNGPKRDKKRGAVSPYSTAPSWEVTR